MKPNDAPLKSNEDMETQSHVFGVLSVLGLLGAMILSLSFVGPSGQRMDLTGFLMLWSREILLIGPLVLLCIATIPVMLWRLLKLCYRHIRGLR
jgi:hypothetical protein